MRIVRLDFTVHDGPETIGREPVERHAHHLADFAGRPVGAHEVLRSDDLLLPRLRVRQPSRDGVCLAAALGRRNSEVRDRGAALDERAVAHEVADVDLLDLALGDGRDAAVPRVAHGAVAVEQLLAVAVQHRLVEQRSFPQYLAHEPPRPQVLQRPRLDRVRAPRVAWPFCLV